MHQTQLYENLLQVERKVISLLRAQGLSSDHETSVKIETVKSELPDFDGDVDSLIAMLGFISVNDGNLRPLTHQILSSDLESLSCQVIVKL
jgi:hypothetical protein